MVRYLVVLETAYGNYKQTFHIRHVELFKLQYTAPQVFCLSGLYGLYRFCLKQEHHAPEALASLPRRS